jgi:outer membrane protein OmpA-like peptidoglycan-associated protein
VAVPSAVDTPDPATASPPTTVPPTPTIQVIAPGDALFGPGSSELLPESFDALEESLNSVVTTGTVARASVRCHTDNQGSAEYNNRLSQSRSDTIVEVLVTLGVQRTRIDARGLGISQTYDNSTETGRALNRRCEIELGVQP